MIKARVYIGLFCVATYQWRFEIERRTRIRDLFGRDSGTDARSVAVAQ